MKINFDEEQDSDNTENNMKIPNTDLPFKEQVKLEEVQNIKNSIKSQKSILIFFIIFFILLIIYQLLQDYRISIFVKEISNLKLQITEMKSYINNINENIINNTAKNNILKEENKDNIDHNKIKSIVNFSAETTVLKNKFDKEIKYLQDCMLENRIKSFNKYENPKISIIVPLYKSESYIYRFIQSIQKQELKELEIIFIQDSSFDEKKSKINEISKIDKRIILLQNNKNITLLNSYIRGISHAKSEYILFLEEDSILLPNFIYIYDMTKKENKDINEYSTIKGTLNGITFDERTSDKEKSKDEILESYYNYNFVNENPLMNKIIKTEVLKNAINSISNFYLEANFDIHVDSLIYISLCSIAQSYKAFGDLYVAFNLKKTLYKDDEFLEKMLNSTIYLANFIYELKTDNMDLFNRRCLLVINLINWPLNYNRKMNLDMKNANDIINKFMTNKLINEENIRKLKNIQRRIYDRQKS